MGDPGDQDLRKFEKHEVNSKQQKKNPQKGKQENMQRENTKQLQATTQQCRAYWFSFFFGFCFMYFWLL